jgi:trk system potassium uptake protein TrkA
VRVVVVGGGSVGSAMAADLRDNGHDVQVLEADVDRAETLREHLIGVDVVASDGCEVDSLEAVGLRTADVVVAATGDDEDNLVISWLSKQEFAVPRVISRVNNAKNAWMFNESWGVDVSVSTPQLLTALVEEAVTVGSIVRLMELDRSGGVLLEVTLDADSPAIANHQTLGDLPLPGDADVVAIMRDEKVVAPRQDTRLAEGDHVIVLATHAAEELIERIFVAD